LRELLIAALIFLCLAGASIGTLLTYRKLKPQHRHKETGETVRLIANLFVVMTSLVLGLMINASRSGFEEVNRNVHGLASQLIVLDRTLRAYGPETGAARRDLLAYAERARSGTWPAKGAPLVSDPEAERLLTAVGTDLRAIETDTPMRTELLRDARVQFQQVEQMRWVLTGESAMGIPGSPFILMLTAWLTLIFASIAFRAPRSKAVIAIFLVAAGLIAGTLFLVMDLDRPFDGPIHVSPRPFDRTIAEMRRG
jgi:hypothetical protein